MFFFSKLVQSTVTDRQTHGCIYCMCLPTLKAQPWCHSTASVRGQGCLRPTTASSGRFQRVPDGSVALLQGTDEPVRSWGGGHHCLPVRGTVRSGPTRHRRPKQDPAISMKKEQSSII